MLTSTITSNTYQYEYLPNNDLLSFLFKYPISTLTNEEANQVEMLIKTLILQKPVLRASDLCTIGIRLVAPVSGFVLTYVLVAVQFHEVKPK
ncbi:hypothetical protein FQA39_LY05238 [Lamprigera yunnana]|nr:hypothetical protein FQA39_LY05238 [Lamprigera yunnana]